VQYNTTPCKPIIHTALSIRMSVCICYTSSYVVAIHSTSQSLPLYPNISSASPPSTHQHIYTSLTPLLGISASTISNPLRLGYRLLNTSTSQPLSAFSLAELTGFVGDADAEVMEPPVCRFLGFGGKRGAGPDGARRFITGGAEVEEEGRGLAYVRSCWLDILTGLRAMVGG
jgi:hypothetical protein